MKALVYRRFGPAEVLEWTPDWPEPALTPGSVLVRTAAGGVNPKDVLLRKGRFRALAREPLPRVTGLEAAGEIVAVGPEVSGFAVGDRVFGMSNRFCGGVHAEIARFLPEEIFQAPSTISLEEAACVPLAAQTALQALRDCGRIQPGHKVLINGASGGVGHFAVPIAKALGAEVHAVCGPGSVEFVASLGADTVVNYAHQPATAVACTFDVVFDVFGKFTRGAFARQLGRRGIHVSTVPKPATIAAEALARLGFGGAGRLVQVRSRGEDLRRIKEWIDNGVLAPHVERVYPASRAADAHRHVETRHTKGKVAIDLRG